MANKILIALLTSILLLSSCRKDQSYSIKIIDGVEIVNNSYKGIGKDLQFELKLLTDVDLDSLKLPQGVPAIESFRNIALDDNSNIYLTDFRRCVVYKLDKEGNYITNFCRRGSGPGEHLVISQIEILKDTVYLIGGNGKVSLFTTSGVFVDQKLFLDGKYTYNDLMVSDNLLVGYSKSMEADWDQNFQKTSLLLNLLDNKSLEPKLKVLEINSIEDFGNYHYGATNERRQCTFGFGQIFIEDLSKNYYGIDVYDLKGTKIRRIKKQSRHITCSEKVKTKVKKMNQRPGIRAIADYMKQILAMDIDKNNNLWVKPAVEGYDYDHNFYDIFNSKGIFQQRVKLPLPESFNELIFDKSKLIITDPSNCKLKIFNYRFS